MDSLERPAKLRKIEHAGKNSCNGVADSQQTSVATTGPEEESKLGSAALEDERTPVVAQPAEGHAQQIAVPPSELKALSKNQQKKLRKRREWEAKAPLRKAKKKEQRKAKKERDKSRRANEDDATREARSALRRDGVSLPITVVFDCGYDDLMYEKEIISLGSQLTRCYSENRNAKFKAELMVSSFSGRLKDRFDTVLKGAHKSWSGFAFTTAAFDVAAGSAMEKMEARRGGILGGAFARYQPDPNADGDAPPLSEDSEHTPGEVIYLSSDSDYTLTELRPYSTYIVGGLVDRNRYKGKCRKAAMGKGVKTARLPIGEYLDMSSRHILTTNHVLEIMLRWLELGDWGAAFTAVIPKRKGGVLKSTGSAKQPDEEAECVIEDSGGDSSDDSDSDERLAKDGTNHEVAAKTNPSDTNNGSVIAEGINKRLVT